METVVVTRHHGLIEYLRAEGLAPADCEVIDHATPDAVRGKRVIGVLPLWLAAEAAEVVEIPMSIPPELRGVELTAEQTAEHAGEPRTYRVEAVSQ
jgi:putative CRISPR-associated protein (TIGR02620 family)